jgi:hypothetical protein
MSSSSVVWPSEGQGGEARTASTEPMSLTDKKVVICHRYASRQSKFLDALAKAWRGKLQDTAARRYAGGIGWQMPAWHPNRVDDALAMQEGLRCSEGLWQASW